MNNFDITETRKNLVAKDNRMIQNSRMSLSLLENKAVLYIISKIRPDDEKGKKYIFNCGEFCSLLNWNKEASYQNVKLMLQTIGNASWWIEGEEKGRKKEFLVRWFDIVHMDPGTGDVEIRFHEDMFPFLLDLQKHREEDGKYFTTYKLQNVALMKHRYSPRIYELLKSYQFNNKKWTFENGTGSSYDIQRRIADTVPDAKKVTNPISMIPKSWANWSIFKRDVLDPAVEEINKYTDIKVAYKGKKEDIHHRKTKAIRTIEFYMVGKTGPEQRFTDELIDAEYTVVDEEETHYHQVSIEEIFFKEHEKSLEIEKAEREYFEAVQKEKKIKAATHSILFAELNGDLRHADFDEKKVNQLYSMAIKGRVVGVIPANQWEMFAVDFVTYYYDKILSTRETTKSSVYQRLLDCVIKDYDGKTYDFIEKYKK